MRCKAYDCRNNQDGYCLIDSYVEIDGQGNCESYYVPAAAQPEKQEEEKKPSGLIFPMSEEGKRMLAFQEELVKKYKYKPIIPDMFIGDVRQKYLDALPNHINVEGEPNIGLCTLAGRQISTGYTRVVIGDYGAFVEFSPRQVIRQTPEGAPFPFPIAKGQEYRVNDPKYSENVKYLWLTVNDAAKPKIYFQKKPVAYADYQPGMYYISVYEVITVKPGRFTWENK